MPSNYTPNYELNQWEKADQVLMEDFNADNAKLDEAIGALADRVDQKADASDLTEKTSALTAAVNTINSTLTKKGSCEIWKTTYAGSGKFGAGSPNKLTFPKVPMLVLILGNTYPGLMALAPGSGRGHNTESLSICYATWSGATVSWYAADSASQLSIGGVTYQVFAFYQAS